jgi:hypothetical protein
MIKKLSEDKVFEFIRERYKFKGDPNDKAIIKWKGKLK